LRFEGLRRGLVPLQSHVLKKQREVREALAASKKEGEGGMRHGRGQERGGLRRG
jgi:hypothetical protein